MRRWSLLGALMICVLLVVPAWAEDKALEDRVKKLEESVQQFKEHERQEREREPGLPSEPPSEPGIGPLPEVGKERRREMQAPLSFGSTGSGRLVYAKPFVAAPKAVVGGYMDIQYRSQRKGSIENGYGGLTNNFDQQRFVPFIFADITEHVKFASEIEIEHGIREEGGPDRELEFGLEFAHIDYLVKEPFNLRAGILLLPIGKFNLLHDSPLNDLTDRPLVSQLIIPTTVAETGAGFYGTIYPGRISKVDYEFYVTTGPCGYETNGTPNINEATGTRGARQRKCAADDGFDINNGKTVVGRLAYSPVLGVEVAASSYYGNAAPFANYNPLSITAIDWTLQRGPFELIGEAAWAYARGNSRAISGNTIGAPGPAPAPGMLLTGIGGNSGLGIPPQRMNGLYIQGNYHFMPDFLTKLSPKRFGEGSTFTAVVRYDRVNTNQDNTAGGFGDLEQISFGLNYRPVEDAVFKMSYQYQPMAFNPNTSQRIHDSAFVISAATYF
ncbi:MAG: TonB-dependent receptor [Nitrospirae bacterium]|nr:MAG: TonB-dependent receptor [Nitrospirota bacterium]